MVCKICNICTVLHAQHVLHDIHVLHVLCNVLHYVYCMCYMYCMYCMHYVYSTGIPDIITYIQILCTYKENARYTGARRAPGGSTILDPGVLSGIGTSK